MDRFLLLAPAVLLFASMFVALVVYTALCTFGRAPRLENVKHNQLLGPFMASYLVWLISPVERALVGRVSPNFVTSVSLACCAATGIVAGAGYLGPAVWLYTFGGILDILDGRLARRSKRQTKSGALFDSVSDRWAELFVFTGYAWYLRETPWLFAVLAAMGSSLMVSYT
ncbi:MAG TPA: CDP-alcohol phosphatidyltransferase family protein, partial [Kofleriaceae bacterium]|nr:CDP-alcohol phosphatidyltransferase family protein [Kofleriaceae bacterium]